MLKRVIVFLLVLLYIYTLTFDIFLNDYFKVPSIILGILMVVFFYDESTSGFLFGWEMLFLMLANLFYYAIGLDNFKPFIINISILISCGLYFNYFVGDNFLRFKVSLVLFFLLLAFSALIMLADHVYPEPTLYLRGKLIGAEIIQSPSGITANIFTFGYQLAALSTFVFLYVLLTKKNVLMVIAVLVICLLTIFYGMQRSALMVFLTTGTIVILIYFKAKSIPIIISVGLIAFMFLTIALKYNTERQSNIFNKTAQNNQMGEDRSGLIVENFKIYADYPFGLIFYNKQWNDVAKNDVVFEGGLTSHNAYLMFITYLGPFIGLSLLVGIYYYIVKLLKKAILKITLTSYALLASLCFAFLAVSMNSLFHNAWLINANGPTVFLYFAILHLGKSDLMNKAAD